MNTGSPAGEMPQGQPVRPGYMGLPSTRLGRWAAALGVAFIVLFLVNSFVLVPMPIRAPWMGVVLPFYGIIMLLCGLASGVIGLLAVVRRGERSWLALLALLPGLLVLFLLLGEFLAPH